MIKRKISFLLLSIICILMNNFSMNRVVKTMALGSVLSSHNTFGQTDISNDDLYTTATYTSHEISGNIRYLITCGDNTTEILENNNGDNADFNIKNDIANADMQLLSNPELSTTKKDIKINGKIKKNALPLSQIKSDKITNIGNKLSVVCYNSQILKIYGEYFISDISPRQMTFVYTLEAPNGTKENFIEEVSSQNTIQKPASIAEDRATFQEINPNSALTINHALIIKTSVENDRLNIKGLVSMEVDGVTTTFSDKESMSLKSIGENVASIFNIDQNKIFPESSDNIKKQITPEFFRDNNLAIVREKKHMHLILGDKYPSEEIALRLNAGSLYFIYNVENKELSLCDDKDSSCTSIGSYSSKIFWDVEFAGLYGSSSLLLFGFGVSTLCIDEKKMMPLLLFVGLIVYLQDKYLYCNVIATNQYLMPWSNLATSSQNLVMNLCYLGAYLVMFKYFVETINLMQERIACGVSNDEQKNKKYFLARRLGIFILYTSISQGLLNIPRLFTHQFLVNNNNMDKLIKQSSVVNAKNQQNKNSNLPGVITEPLSTEQKKNLGYRSYDRRLSYMKLSTLTEYQQYAQLFSEKYMEFLSFFDYGVKPLSKEYQDDQQLFLQNTEEFFPND